MRPFLILQLRPEDEAAEGEFRAFLTRGGLPSESVHRIRLDQERLPKDLALETFAGVIVGGGPGCVSDPRETKQPVEKRIEDEILSLMPRIVGEDIPFLGCCYGIGLLAHYLGAEVSKRRFGEPVGPVEVTRTPEGADDPLLDELPQRFTVLVGHKEAVQELPERTVHLLTSGPCPYQMIRSGKNVYATQFHPEADGEVFADRIRIYRNRGYFRPEDADELTRISLAATADLAPRILRNFVKRYGGEKTR